MDWTKFKPNNNNFSINIHQVSIVQWITTIIIKYIHKVVDSPSFCCFLIVCSCANVFITKVILFNEYWEVLSFWKE